MDLPCEIDQFEIHVSCFWVDTCIEFVHVQCKRKVAPLLFKAVCSIQSDFENVSLQESLHLAVQTFIYNSNLLMALASHRHQCYSKLCTKVCIDSDLYLYLYYRRQYMILFTGWLLWGLVKPQKLMMCYYFNWNQLITIGSDVKKLQKGNVTAHPYISTTMSHPCQW